MNEQPNPPSPASAPGYAGAHREDAADARSRRAELPRQRQTRWQEGGDPGADSGIGRAVAIAYAREDVQMMKLAADKRSMRNLRVRTSSSWSPALPMPPAEQLRSAAEILNSGSLVAVLAGQGALSARDEVTTLADRLGAPVAKALFGKAVLPDDSPYTTGGIGDLGTAPSTWIMKNCDTVLILGSTMPWEEYYPNPEQARGVQVDLKPDRLGLRYPVEVGCVAAPGAQARSQFPVGGAATHDRMERAARPGGEHKQVSAPAADGHPGSQRSLA